MRIDTKIYNTSYYQKNKEKMKQTRKEWYQANKERASEYAKRWHLQNRDTSNANRARESQEARNKILEKFGNKCTRCGFDDKRALQIDHINGGGQKEIKKINNSRKYYLYVLQDTTNKYQILCANCNWIKRRENKEFVQPTYLYE